MAQTTIPAVPKSTPMFDRDGRLTRTWIIFFERIQRLLQQQQAAEATTEETTVAAAAQQGHRTTFVLEDTATDAACIPLEQILTTDLAGYADIVCDPGPTEELIVDITVDGQSIFATQKLTVPAGTAANQVIRQIVLTPSVSKGSIWSAAIVSGDGTALASVVIPWKQ